MVDVDDDKPEQEDDSPKLLGHCEICQGPIYFGEMISYRTENEVFYMSHRFSTWCEHYEKQRSKFLSDCGIAVEGKEHGNRDTAELQHSDRS